MLNLLKNFLAKKKAKKLDKELRGKKCVINGLIVDGKEVVALIDGVKYDGTEIKVFTLWRYGITRYNITQ
jgi:hypothetical protein